MSDFLGRAQALQKQQAELTEKAQNISSFLDKFILTDDEVRALRSDPVDAFGPQGTLGVVAGACLLDDSLVEHCSGYDGRRRGRGEGGDPTPSLMWVMISLMRWSPPGCGCAGDKPFFSALRRLQEIRSECSQLVGSKHQSAGFELFEVRALIPPRETCDPADDGHPLS
jgi:hypothetical protein